jgi:hypothetical protein
MQKPRLLASQCLSVRRNNSLYRSSLYLISPESYYTILTNCNFILSRTTVTALCSYFYQTACFHITENCDRDIAIRIQILIYMYSELARYWWWYREPQWRSVETDYGLGGRGIGVRFLAGARDFPPQRPDRLWGQWLFPGGIKWQWLEADNSSPSNVKVKEDILPLPPTSSCDWT